MGVVVVLAVGVGRGKRSRLLPVMRMKSRGQLGGPSGRGKLPCQPALAALAFQPDAVTITAVSAL